MTLKKEAIIPDDFIKINKGTFEHLDPLYQLFFLKCLKKKEKGVVLENVTYRELIEIAASQDNLARYMLIKGIFDEKLYEE